MFVPNIHTHAQPSNRLHTYKRKRRAFYTNTHTQPNGRLHFPYEYTCTYMYMYIQSIHSRTYETRDRVSNVIHGFSHIHQMCVAIVVVVFLVLPFFPSLVFTLPFWDIRFSLFFSTYLSQLVNLWLFSISMFHIYTVPSRHRATDHCYYFNNSNSSGSSTNIKKFAAKIRTTNWIIGKLIEMKWNESKWKEEF